MNPALLTVVALFASGLAQAADDKRAPILARALSYEYTLKNRAGDALSIAVLYKAGSSSSDAAAEAWVKAFKSFEGVKVQGLPLGVVKIGWDSADRVKGLLSAQGIDILVVADGLDTDLGAVRDLARGLKILTVGEKMSYLEDGLTLGVVDAGGKLTIVINLSSAAQEGITFSSELLKLAKVIR